MNSGKPLNLAALQFSHLMKASGAKCPQVCENTLQILNF